MADIKERPLTLGDLKQIAHLAYPNHKSSLARGLQEFEAQVAQTPYIKVRFRGGLQGNTTYKLANGRAKVGDAVTVTSSASFGAVAIVTAVDVPKPTNTLSRGVPHRDAVLIDPKDRARLEAGLGVFS